MTCKARQYSDQMICDACALQWDVNDPEPPVCGPVDFDLGEEDLDTTRLCIYQDAATVWLSECHGEYEAECKTARAAQFFEEAVELALSCGVSVRELDRVVDKAISRPRTDIAPRVGGVMATLAGLCGPCGVDLEQAAQDGLLRVYPKPEGLV